MENKTNVIDLVKRIQQRDEIVKEEVNADMPFAESSAELLAEFLFFCRKRKPTLHKFCDLLCDELKDGSEQSLLDMMDRIKKNVALTYRIRKRSATTTKFPIRSKRKRIRKNRRRIHS